MKIKNNIQVYFSLFLFFVIFYTIVMFFGISMGEHINIKYIFTGFVISFICSIINGSIIITSIFFLQKYNIYKWEKVAIWFLSILTTIAVLFSMGSDGLGILSNLIAYIVDILIACFVNVLILTLIFFVGNWIYSKIVGKKKKCPVCAEMIKKDAKKCRFCGEKIKQEDE
jgi:hypothetical protein